MAGTCSGDLLPELPGPQCEAELAAAGPAADPDQAEVADRGPARAGLPFQLDDVQAALAGLHVACIMPSTPPPTITTRSMAMPSFLRAERPAAGQS